MGVPDLIERGIRAYLAGREPEALAAFREVLAIDPDNSKARWYLDRIGASEELAVARRTHIPLPPAATPAALLAGARTPVPAAAPSAGTPTPVPIAGAVPGGAPTEPLIEHEIELALTPVPLPERALDVQPVPAFVPPVPAPSAAVPEPTPAAPLAAVPPPPSAPPSAPPPEEARAAAHAVIAAALGLVVSDPRPELAATPAPAPIPAPAPCASPTPTADAAAVAPADLEPDLHVHDEDYAPSPWDEGPAAAATIVLDPAGGLDLGAVEEQSDLRPLVPEGARPSPGPKSDVEVWLAAAKELFALGDFTGSLELIEKILQVDPDHGEARDYLRQNEATLISMYESKLGPLTRVPRLAIKPEEILWLNLDHRAGFLLAQIDGSVDYDSLFALSGLPRLDTARILANLIADGVIRS